MYKIDAKGWLCPKPVIETKKLLDSITDGEVCTLVDNETSVENLKRFAQSSGYGVENQKEGDLFKVVITKGDGSQVTETSSVTQASSEGSLIIVISSDRLGYGEEELGKSLMKGYLYALTEASKKPKTLIFMNSGVSLTSQGTEALESLQELEKQGVEILSCGACLNFYNLSEKLVIGEASNMYHFVELMNGATNTIKL